MAEAVAQSVDRGEHLLVQAGTGTGKSLGYLVPAVRHAVLADERVVVSTATLALQRQVVARDLPLVADALAGRLPRRPTTALLKGWHNYLCVHKVAGGYPEDDTAVLFDLGERRGAADHPAPDAEAGRESLGDQVVRLREWAQETDSGDRDDLVPGVSDRAWRQVSVTSLECLGSTCPMVDECFPERARAAARAADVVVTNHAMLGIAASGSPNVLPEHQVLIVDEAHELTDRVTAQATDELSLATVEHAARLARRHGGVPTTDLDAAGRALAAALVELPETRFADGLPPAVRDVVGSVRDAARALLSALKPDPGRTAAAGGPDGGVKMASTAMLSLFEVAERMTADPEAARRQVLWCSRSEDRRGGTLTRLLVAPLAVHGLIRTNLLAGRSAVLTSATLTLGGSFEPVARSMGLTGPPEATAQPAVETGVAPERPSNGDEATQPWRGLDVGSPFDYGKQGICYVARHRHSRSAGRDRGVGARRRRSHARPVLVPPGRTGGRRGDAAAARRPGAVAGRRPAAHLGRAVLGRRVDVPVRHPVAVAGRRRAGRHLPAGDHRPHPVPEAGRPPHGGSHGSRRGGRGERVHGGVRDARGPAARAGCGSADPDGRRPGCGGGPGPSSGDRSVRHVPDQEHAAVLDDDPA